MQDTDARAFERALSRLCGGFNVPATDARREAFWRSFRKLSVLEFTGLIDLALVESTFTEMPTVGALWDLHRKHSTPNSPLPPAGRAGPSIEEQLCEYAALQLHLRLHSMSFSAPWTYVYREWMDGDKRCAECTGIVIEDLGGKRFGFSVSAMRADTQLHGQVMRSFRPGAKPAEKAFEAAQGFA